MSEKGANPSTWANSTDSALLRAALMRDLTVRVSQVETRTTKHLVLLAVALLLAVAIYARVAELEQLARPVTEN